MAAYELVLDKDYVGIRQRLPRPRPATAPAREQRAAAFVYVSPVGRIAQAARLAYLGALAVLALALAGMLLLDGGWQAASAGVAVGAGSAALIALLVLAVLRDAAGRP